MTVCYFGIYNPNHTRNRLNIKGLRLNGVEVLECNIREKSWGKYWQLIRLHWPMRHKYQVMIVGFPGHTIMPLAWLLAKLHGKSIIFDAFISLYDSFVFDEKKYRPRSLPALKYWFVDWLACRLANVIMLEAYEYAKYFIQTFKINPKKFRRVLVSCDEEIMYPRENPRKDGKFVVHFHGTYIPAQGIDYIIGAAALLEDEGVYFNIIGRLKDYQPVIEQAKKDGLTNINFYDFMPYERLAEMMAEADMCLGMFGDTAKAKRAGAFKIMEAMAMKKPLVTANTPAVREFLVDRENAILCRIADSQDLSKKIMLLKNDPTLRNQIAQNGYDLFLKTMTPKVIGEQLTQIAKSL
ncbi:MAG: glycosyltransferase [bacterium]|nr:glycosyltransferase [bacterium]